MLPIRSLSPSNSKTPKYWQLAETLRQKIEARVLQPGERLSSVAEMQLEQNVSLSTVNRVYALLESEGLIVREQGRGTFVAQSQAVRSVKTLGLLFHVSSLSGTYITELLKGIRQEASQQKLELLWLNDEEVNQENRVDALLLYCHPTEAFVLNIPAHIPQVLLFQHDPNFTCVSSDDFDGAYRLVQHLLELGHRRIAYLISSDHDSISRQRLAGYQAALKEAGIGKNKDWVRFLGHNPKIESYRQSGERALDQWLNEDWEQLGCTALLAHNDETAIGAIKALQKHGLSVPDDVSVVGFDGTELSELSTPELTTVQVPLQDLGATAVKVLTQQIKEGTSAEQERVILPVRLKKGSSASAVLKIAIE